MHGGTVERKKLSINRKKPLAQLDPERAPQSASISWGFRVHERGDNKHHNTKTIMSYVHGGEKKQSEERQRCIMGGPLGSMLIVAFQGHVSHP